MQAVEYKKMKDGWQRISQKDGKTRVSFMQSIPRAKQTPKYELSAETLAALRIGDAPPTVRQHMNRHAARTEIYARAAAELGMPYGRGADPEAHNDLIDRLDREYPGWRGYSVPTERSHANN